LGIGSIARPRIKFDPRAARAHDPALDEVLPPERLADLLLQLRPHGELDMATLALAVGVASFVFFVGLQEWQARAESRGALALAGSARA
jgi:hypothetical protein